MANQTDQDDCPTKKPFTKIISDGLKKGLDKAIPAFMEEGARSLGKVILYVVAGIVVLWLLGSVIDSFTGLFSGWLDWVPNPFSWFGGSEETAVEAAATPTTPDTDEEPGPICSRWTKFNPFCD